MAQISDRLRELGWELPPPPAPVAAYRPAVRRGEWVFVSGQLPFRGGVLTAVGRVGAEVSVEAAREAAQVAALNALAAAAQAAGGVDALEAVTQVTGFVQCTADFHQQPAVVDGASEVLAAVFGPGAGAHARAAVGVLALPLNAAVEVAAVFYCRREPVHAG
jgi:enamine deaminase RidA (YjgF/YER057c/UK114 family)